MKRILLESVDSTNKYIWENIDTLSEDTLVIAKRQTNGKGQFDRTWFSEPNKSITMSFLFWNKGKDFMDAIRKTPHIIAETLNGLYGIHSKVVLPNDIYLDDRKLCGILIEPTYIAQAISCIIVGIGINLNNDVFPDEIKDIATSIKIATNKPADVNEIVNILENKMEVLYV